MIYIGSNKATARITKINCKYDPKTNAIIKIVNLYNQTIVFKSRFRVIKKFVSRNSQTLKFLGE